LRSSSQQRQVNGERALNLAANSYFSGNKALAKADLESLEPQEALRRLDSLKESSPEDFEVWSLLGQAQCALGDGPRALESWRRAVWLKTSDSAARRKIALALARSGDAEGREALRQILLETPNDQELKSFLSQPSAPGPLPDPCLR
jgi:cytochrome c-type biogenesis protein CcmH/NrfG